MCKPIHHATTVSRLLGSLFLAGLLLLSARQGQAGVVVSFGGASGPGLATMSFNNILTPSPQNDDVAGTSPNTIRVNQKAYDTVDYIDMVFEVSSPVPGGDTEYDFGEGVDNGTGVPWTDYHVQLGFGTGAGFVLSTPGDGLDFDAPDLNSLFDFFPFTSVAITQDELTVDGGIFPSGDFNVFRFPIDVPDGISWFTVRQFPTTTVPEPATMSLVAMGALGMIVRRKRTCRGSA